MSNNESFIDEVTDEVRREKLFGYLKRFGWIGVVGVLALVGGAAWYEWQKSTSTADAQAFGDQLLTALDAPDSASRFAALNAVQTSGDRAVLRALLAAGEAFGADDQAATSAARETAIAGLKAASEEASASQVWRDLAALRWLTAPGAAIEPAARTAGLEALAEPGRPYRPLALEHLAFDKVAAGENEAALADFRMLQSATEAPSALRNRAGQMIVILGGDPAPVVGN